MEVKYPEGIVAAATVLVTQENGQNVVTLHATPNVGTVDFIHLATDGIKTALEASKVNQSVKEPPKQASKRVRKITPIEVPKKKVKSYAKK